MLFTGGIRLTEDPRFSLAGPTNSTLMVTKTFGRIANYKNMISGDRLGCHGQWILRVPDHGSRDCLYFAHSSCLAVILSAGRRIHCFFFVILSLLLLLLLLLFLLLLLLLMLLLSARPSLSRTLFLCRNHSQCR